VFHELAEAEARVAELEEKVEQAYFVDKNRDVMTQQIEVTNKRIEELGTRLDEAANQNRHLDRELEEKKKLEVEFNQICDDMDEMMKKMEMAKERSKRMEKEIIEARKREGELYSAKIKLRNMDHELDDANRNLARLENALVNSIKKWRKEPGDFTRMVVNPGTSGKVTKTTTDAYGRPYKNGVKAVEIKDTRSPNDHARKMDFRLRGKNEVGLRRTVLTLEREKSSKELRKELLIGQNDKLARQVSILKAAMKKMGISVGGTGTVANALKVNQTGVRARAIA